MFDNPHKDATNGGSHHGGGPRVCDRCGPFLHLLGRGPGELVTCSEALLQAGFGILEGEIVGLRGFGQAHYLVDSRREGAVSRLRLKRKIARDPLTLMYAAVELVRIDFGLSEFDERLLAAPDSRGVRLPRRRSARETPFAPGVAGEDSAWFPVTLAKTRLHRMLLSQLAAPVAVVEESEKRAGTSNQGGALPSADFTLVLDCPAWVPEEASFLPDARCALGSWPDRGAPLPALRRRP